MLMLQYSHVTHAITLHSTPTLLWQLHDCTSIVVGMMRYKYIVNLQVGELHSHDISHVCMCLGNQSPYPIALYSIPIL